MIQLGLIGCGRWGRNYVTAASEAGNCTVAATAGDAFVGVPQVASMNWRVLLGDPNIDAFVVAAPPEAHEEICCELLRSGRPVMVEKPMALRLAPAIRIAKAAERAKVPLLVNHQHLFSHAYEALCSQVAHWSEAVVITMGGGEGPKREYSALWDYGPHDVAMFLGLAPNRRAEVVMAKKQGPGGYRLQLVAGNRTGFVRVWNHGPAKVRHLAVIGNFERADRWVYDDQSPERLHHHMSGAVPLPYEPPLTRSLRAFAHAVEVGTDDWRFDPYFGVEVTRILAQAQALTEASDGSRD